MGIVILNKQNEFRLFGRVKNVDFDYKRKGDTETIPVLELELEVPYNGAPDVVRVTAFYDKAERAAEEVEAGDWIVARGRIKSSKGQYKDKITFNTDFWASYIEKVQTAEIPE